jgi:hypothetical protein
MKGDGIIVLIFADLSLTMNLHGKTRPDPW